MITSFDDFCTWMYVLVDDIWQGVVPLFKRPGPQPICSDSELLTMAIVGECRGWDEETVMLSNWRERRDLFTNVPSQNRFNPLRFLLTGGQRHDITQAEDLIAGYEFERVIADRSYIIGVSFLVLKNWASAISAF